MAPIGPFRRDCVRVSHHALHREIWHKLKAEVVKGYAQQEQKVLIGVTEARARANSIQVTPQVLNNPELFQKYQAAQFQVNSICIMQVERYRTSKSLPYGL